MPISSGAIRAGRAFVELTTRDDTNKGLDRLAAKMRRLRGTLFKVSAVFAGIGATIATPLAAAVRHFTTLGDQVQKLGVRTGLTAEQISEIAFAANKSGTNIKQFGNSMIRAQRRVANAATGMGPAVRALKDIGVNAADLSVRPAIEQFNTLADALAGVESETLRNQYAFEIFGDEWKAILPLLKQGSAGLADMRSEARDLGLTMSQDQADAAADLSDAFMRLRSVAEATFFKLGAAIAPAVKRAVDLFAGLAVAVNRFIEQNPRLVQAVGLIGLGFVAVGGVLASFAVALGVLAAGFAALGVVVAGLGSIFAAIASPIGLVVAAIAAVTAGVAAALFMFTDLSKHLAEVFQVAIAGTGKIFADMFNGILRALQSGDLAAAGRIALSGLQAIFATVLDNILTRWEDTFRAMFVAIGEFVKRAMIEFGKFQVFLASFLRGFAENLVLPPAVKKQLVAQAKEFEQVAQLQKFALETAAPFAGQFIAADLFDSLRDGIRELKQVGLSDMAESISGIKDLPSLFDPAKFEAAGAQLSRQFSAVGGFSGELLARQGGRIDLEIAKNTKLTADRLGELLEMAPMTGVSFG